MKAITVIPMTGGSAALDEIAEPPGPADGVLVETLAIGVCGTDIEILDGRYGEPPPGGERLVIGHESLGRVIDPRGSELSTGDHVVGIVRRPDPVPCSCCARGAWDMCLNGRFTERGIKGLHGFASERFLIEPEFVVKVDPALGIAAALLEPASILAKAWRRIEHLISECSPPAKVLVTGAGPIGLLAALLGVQKGLEVHVLDRVEEGPKPELVRDLGARYHTSTPAEACPDADITLECTGAPALLFEVIENSSRNGVVCLTGVSSPGREESVDAGSINRDIVLENDIVFGSVNASRGDYVAAAGALGKADGDWLDRVVTRRIPLERWAEAYEARDGDVKTVLVFAKAT
ncbi:MAG: glucose 1-dehydrogenase [Actinomycetota bacterium]